MTEPTRPLDSTTGAQGDTKARASTSPQQGLVAVMASTAAAASIVTSTLQALGLHDLFHLADRLATTTPGRDHSVASIDEHVLSLFGGSAWSPPPLPPDFENDASLDELSASTKELVDYLIESDPSCCVLCGTGLSLVVPFWRRALRRPILSVVVVDSPKSAAQYLHEHHAISYPRALALYERHLRVCLTHLRGEPTMVVLAEQAAREQRATSEAIGGFLSDHGLVACVDRSDLVVPQSIELGRLKDAAADEALTSLVLPEIESLYHLATSLRGPHVRLPNVELPPESPWSAALLSVERDLDQALGALFWTTDQLEAVVRATPRRDQARQAPRSSDEEELEASETKEGAPYPLNASEDRRAYHRWLTAHRQPIIVGGPDDPPVRKAKHRRFVAPRSPLISVIVPVYQSPIWALERCVGSVLKQSFADWELCICDDASNNAELSAYLRRLSRVDRRIKVTALASNGGISKASNEALFMAKGRFVAFLDHDDELRPNALEVVAAAIEANSDADVLYSDEDKIDQLGERFDPLFKPDWSPDLLLSFAYLCHLSVFRKSLVDELGGLRSEFDGSQDYDLSLRATERARRIVHIPEVLYHWRTLPGSAASDSPHAVAKPWAYAAGRRAIEDALQRRGEEGEVTTVPGFPGRYHVRRKPTGHPLVSIVIPFRDEPGLLAACARSLMEDPGYDNVELVLVDNASELPETEALLDQLAESQPVRIVRAPGPFNWAAINNAAVRACEGEVLLFANNDIEARAERWLDALLGHALRPEVGAVGARLLYPDGSIQHAGVVIGLGGVAGHVLRGLPGDHPGYNSMAIQTRNCSVVTGACMMTRREIFESIGGFDEKLPVAFNDVDYCLKLREKGYLVVYTPLAELVHHESKSRGHTDDLAEQRRIVSRWANALVEGDPYFNKHLSHWRYWCPLTTQQEEDRWKNYLETSVLTRESSSST